VDKDWICIFKKFIRYGSGVKKSISAHLCSEHYYWFPRKVYSITMLTISLNSASIKMLVDVRNSGIKDKLKP